VPCTAAKLLSRDEARRIATNIAKLPELFGKAKRHNNLPRTFSIARGCRQGPQLARSVAPLREPS